MTTRLLTFLMVLALCWPGAAVPDGSATTAVASLGHDAGHAPADLPAAGHAENTSDLPGLWPEPGAAPVPPHVSTWPHLHDTAAPLAPDLAGPHRPPCARRFIA